MRQRRFHIETMRPQDLVLAVAWAAAEGWNPGLNDAACFYATDPTGFLMGWLDDEPIASISVVKYGEAFAFLGFYIVQPAYRGLGYGWQIWQAGMATLAGRTVGLDGVVAQQENYKKSGFVWAYANVRYEGTAVGRPALLDPAIVAVSSLPFAEIEAYDRPFFPDNRQSFLQCWVAQPQSVALGIFAEGQLAGYGVVRPCQTGHKIGPLFADSPELAQRLLVALQSHLPEGTPFFLDVPAVNKTAVALAQRQQMQVVFETARMYKGAIPALPLHRLFGVTTFELG